MINNTMKKLLLPIILGALLTGCNETATVNSGGEFTAQQKADRKSVV